MRRPDDIAEGAVLRGAYGGLERHLRSGGLDDLRRPLWTMLAAVNALQRSSQLGARERRLVDVLDAGLERVLGVVRDLVDAQALDDGAPLALFPRATDVLPIARRVAAAARVDHPGRVVWCAFGASGSALWDPERVEQMLSAMAEHALAASDRDSAVLLSARDVGDEWVELEVEFDDADRAGAPSDSLPVTIARHVARGHGGELVVRRGGDGAKRIIARLPRLTRARGRSAGSPYAVEAQRPEEQRFEQEALLDL